MLDWKFIETNHPVAFDKFVNVMFPNTGVPSLSSLTYYDIKKLYRFFDKFGIFLTVEMFTRDRWLFIITKGNGTVVSSQNINCGTREESEICGFIDCFEILEKRLTI